MLHRIACNKSSSQKFPLATALVTILRPGQCPRIDSKFISYESMSRKTEVNSLQIIGAVEAHRHARVIAHFRRLLLQLVFSLQSASSLYSSGSLLYSIFVYPKGNLWRNCNNLTSLLVVILPVAPGINPHGLICQTAALKKLFPRIVSTTRWLQPGYPLIAVTTS